MNTILVLVLLAIVISIVIGFKFNTNAGIVAMMFAFIIGILGMGMKANEVVAYWPTTIIFFMISIALFYNYAVANGTMELLGKKMLYALNGNAKLIPFVGFIVAFVVAFAGAGPSASVIVGPFLFALGAAAGINPIVMACANGLGTLAGADNPFNGAGGLISIGLLEKLGYETQTAFSIHLYAWFNDLFKEILALVIIYLVFRGYKAKRVEVEKPEAYNSVQRKTMIMIIISFLVMIVPCILSLMIKTPAMKLISKFCQPQVVMVICAVIATFMKLGDQKDAFKRMPMNTFLLISGMAFLLGIATKAGLIDAVSAFMTKNIPAMLVGPLLFLFSAFLSFFSGGTSVVCPLMYTLIPGFVAAGMNPVFLTSCIFIGAQSSALSPFSNGGSMIISTCPDTASKDYLTKNMIIVAVLVPILGALMALVGLFSFFSI